MPVKSGGGGGGRRFVPVAVDTPLFATSFATGNFTEFVDCQWTGRNDNCQTYNGTSDYSATVVAMDGRPHVARFEVRDGDIPPFGGGERAEITGPSVCDIAVGDDRWISYDIKLDAAFTAVDWGPVFTQMHGLPSDGTPGFELFADPDGNVYVHNGSTGVRNQVTTINAIKGAWHHVTMHVKFSSDSAVGYWAVWLDGVNVVPQIGRATMISGDTSAYFKMGLYRSDVASATIIASFDDVRFSNTAPSVL